ncbi:MAG TPA: hypothetical protein VNR39_00190 [Pseudolabrys sp.]|nr:hypothetical protein [Pseudolabrys sp.]
MMNAFQCACGFSASSQGNDTLDQLTTIARNFAHRQHRKPLLRYRANRKATFLMSAFLAFTNSHDPRCGSASQLHRTIQIARASFTHPSRTTICIRMLDDAMRVGIARIETLTRSHHDDRARREPCGMRSRVWHGFGHAE